MKTTAEFSADEEVPRARVALLLRHFSRLEDDRERWRVVYPLAEVLLLLTCATIASCDDFDDIVRWGEHHLGFLRRFSAFHHGIPGERWLRALVNRVDPVTARVMACLYAAARLYVNFFQPSFKLAEKRREGAKVIKRYHDPSTPYERALAHQEVPEAVKRRLREQYRTLDPVTLLAEIRAAQEELGNRVDRRGVNGALTLPTASPLPDAGNFAKALGKATETAEPRATHRKPKRRYKKRIRMPSKLDRHLATIETWLAAEPQLTALAIVGRLAERDPETFGPKQHSIVQRLLQALRTRAAEKLLVSTGLSITTTDNHMPGPVDGSDPPTGPLLEQAFTPKDNVPSHPVW